MKQLIKNQKWSISIVVPFILMLVLGMNVTGYADITPVKDRTPQVRDAIVNAVPNISDAANVTAAHLAAITSLNLRNSGITALKTEDFSGMTGLTTLNLFNNQLSSLPDGIFEGLTSLKTIRLGKNAVDPLPLTVSLEKVGTNQFKAVVPSGATFDIVLPITVTNGSITGGTTTLTIPHCSVESGTFTVTRTLGTTAAVTVDIGTLPSLPRNHYGYALTKSDSLPIDIISRINTAPVFTYGTSVTRSVAERTAASENIGTPIAATDAENDTLTYTLSGTDASAFDVDSTTGQLKTKAALDYETKTSYRVTLSVSDGSLSGNITVTINVTDIDEDITPPITPDSPTANSAPFFYEGDSTTRVVPENTPAGVNIGNAVLATDANNDFLGYTLGGVDADAFDMDSSGQLKTKAPLDYETKRVYLVTITVDDEELSSTITVIISVIDVNDTVLSMGFVPVANRTSQVRDAIVAAVPNVTDAVDVTESQVAAITNLNLRNKGIASLKTGDFSGMTSLSNLNLFGNQISSLPAGTFDGLTALSVLRLGSNAVDPVPLIVSLQQIGNNTFKAVITTGAPFNIDLPLTVTGGSISGGTTSVTIPQGAMESKSFTVIGTSAEVSFGTLPGLPRNHFGYELAQSTVCNRTAEVAAAIAKAVGAADCSGVTELDIATITSLDLSGQSIASLSADDFDGMLSLRTLSLSNNDLTSLPSGIFDDLISLRELHLNSNNLTSIPHGFFKDLTQLRQLHLSANLVDPLPLIVSLQKVGTNQLKATVPTGAPFTIELPIRIQNGTLGDGTTALRIPIGKVESQLLTVTRTTGITDVVTADIGTLPSLPSLHNGYALVKGIGGPLEVLPSLNSPPIFMDGTTTTRTVAENTVANANIGTTVAATDRDKNTLTYTLGGTDAAAFTVDSAIGQLKTKVALDYETKSIYTVTLTVSDGKLNDVINVTINVSNVNEAPTFTDGSSVTREIAENTSAGENIGKVITATDPDDDTLTYSLGGTEASTFALGTTTGQLRTSAALDYETKSLYTLVLTVSDGNLTDTIAVTINVTDVQERSKQQVVEVETPTNNAPMFTEGSTTTRTVLEGTFSGVDIGTAVSATDADGHSLTYTLGGTDAAAYSIDSTSGQLRTNAALDFETKSSYAVTITASDGTDTATINVTINVSNATENSAPTFTAGTSTTRSVAENTGSGVDIGTPVVATDVDGDTLTYTLGGTDAAAFSMDSTSGQIRTSAALDYESSKTSYSVTITVSDGNGGTDSITVAINVTDIDETPSNNEPVSNEDNSAPSFTEGNSTIRSVAEGTGSGVDIGIAVSATDPDNDTATYSLGGTDADSFSINSTNGQLRTKAALDYETKTSYSVIITVSDGRGGSDSITVTINITDVQENRAPVFSEGSSATRSVPENTASGVNIGNPISANDADNDTLTYALGGTNASSFSMNSTNGQLRTSAALDYETKSSYTITITVSDGSGGSDSISVTINVTDVNENRAPVLTKNVEEKQNSAPVFTEGSSATRTVAENTATGTNIGTAVTATDADNDTLIYTKGWLEGEAFSIDKDTGQIRTKDPLDYETKNVYRFAVFVDDGKAEKVTIIVTINVTDVNETPANNAPVFNDGDSTTRSVAENTASGQNIDTAISATDVDSDNTLTYTLGGTDADSFGIVSSSGQLQTSAALNYESKSSYSVTVSVSDGNGGSDSITVTVNVTNVNEAPVFTDGSSTSRSVAENTASGQNIGTAISATDVDSGNTLTYTLGGTDADAFGIVSTSGQIQTSAALNYEAKTSYSVTVSVSDSNGGSDSITVTINVTNVNEAPVFTDGDNTTRSIAENTALGQNIGTAISATDVDSGNTLTYTLGGTDADSFGIVSTSGQLQTSAALDYESKSSYSVSVSVSDGNGGSDSIAVTINVTNVNEAPSFNTSERVTLSVAENTASGTDIGDPFQATDPDSGDTVTYSLQRADKHTFRINANTGQLQAHAALDYETKSSYSKLAVRATDSGGLVSRVLVTINVTNVNETLGNNTPSFTDGTSTTRTVAENTASDTNIGTAVAATDADSGDTLTYTLSGTDASSFSIVSTSGQLQTSAALDYETKNTYSVTVSVADGNGGTDSIDVSISVTDVDEAGNDPPTFTDGTSTTRSVAENTASGTNIGTAVAATDSDSGDTLTYTLGGTDAASFSIVSTSGQLQTSAALDYETKKSYTVTVSVSDGNGESDSIAVTINVTDVNETIASVSTNITTCSVSHKSGNVYDVTIAGTVTGNHNVRFLTVHGYVNDDPDEIGRDSVGFLDAGETKNFSITGTWTHDGSTSQECSVVLTYQTLGAPSAQSLPAKTALLSNYPNPFNPETWIPYQLGKSAEVTITIYDIRGRVVRTLILGNQPAGVYQSRSKAAHWDGRNHFGEKVATGLYFYTLKAEDWTATRKMLIRK